MSDSATGIRAMLQVVGTLSPRGTALDLEAQAATSTFATGGRIEGKGRADEARRLFPHPCVIDCRS